MDLRKLRYFLTIAYWGSISKASEMLHITQPTLSRQMNELEDELGKKLLTRGRYGVTLTEEGKILYLQGMEIIDLVDKTRNTISGKTDNKKHIAIGVTDSIAIIPVINAIKKMSSIMPYIVFDYYNGADGEIAEKISSGIVDIGVYSDMLAIEHTQEIVITTYAKWGILMRPDCKLAEKESITSEDLNGYPIILPRRQIGRDSVFRSIGSGYGLNLNVIATYDKIPSAGILVEYGVGLLVCLDGYQKLYQNNRLKFVPLEKSELLKTVITRKTNAITDEAIETFWQLIISEISNG